MRLLDLFCGAGGCAVGYSRAGFEVVGVDIMPQPRYPFEFHQSDALGFVAKHGHEFDAIHASPPCQHYARVTRWRGKAEKHPDMVAETRQLLASSGKLWVMENVLESPLKRDFILCGTMFGLPIRRHRAFEVSWDYFELRKPCQHRRGDLPFMHKGERAFANAMGCYWMSSREGRQAIPPAYCEWIGNQLMAALG